MRGRAGARSTPQFGSAIKDGARQSYRGVNKFHYRTPTSPCQVDVGLPPILSRPSKAVRVLSGGDGHALVAELWLLTEQFAGSTGHERCQTLFTHAGRLNKTAKRAYLHGNLY